MKPSLLVTGEKEKKKKGRKKNKPKNALYSFFQNIFKLSGVTH